MFMVFQPPNEVGLPSGPGGRPEQVVPSPVEKNGASMENAEQVPVRTTIQWLRDGTITLATALWHGIPVELAFSLSPGKQKAVMAEYKTRLTAIGDPEIIRNQVKAMLATLAAQFPELEEHSTPWMKIRYHFFNKLGLWGKFG